MKWLTNYYTPLPIIRANKEASKQHVTEAKKPGLWLRPETLRNVLAQNSGFGQGTGGGTRGQSFGPEPEPQPEPWFFCFCDALLVACCLLASCYYGERGVVSILMLLLVACLLASYYYGERGVVINSL